MVGEVCGFFWRRDHVGLVFFFSLFFFAKFHEVSQSRWIGVWHVMILVCLNWRFLEVSAWGRGSVLYQVWSKCLPHWAGISFTSVESELQEGVTELHMNANAFAAVKHDGSILTWGSQKHLGTQSWIFFARKTPQNLETSQNIIDIYIYIHIIHCICTWCLYWVMLELVKIAPPKKQISIVWCKRWNSHNFVERPCAPPTSSQGFWSEKNEIFGAPPFVCF